jgi:hypothetical protein
MRIVPLAALLAALIAAGCSGTDHARHASHEAPAADGRQAVDLPEPLRTHTLANMRDHLAAIQEIQQALADGAPDRAATISESRLGMTSLQSHGAHDVAKFIPAGMQVIGTEMHRAASRFAVEAANAGATGDARKAMGELAAVTRQCVACHAAYRMK